MVVLIGILIVLLVFGPTAYVRWVMARNGAERADLPGTGGELARHLLDAAGLQVVAVEPTDEGDHYDPTARVVRLGPDHLDGRSITAVAVAAHEVAHAVQHRDGSRLFALRVSLLRVIIPLRMVAIALMTVLPLGGALVGAGQLVVPSMVLAIGVFALSIVVQLVTLPLEYEASFSRALPALTQGGYLAPHDLAAARSVLGAAALTYAAGAFLSLLNLARVVRFQR